MSTSSIETAVDQNVQSAFESYADQWRAESRFLSSTSQMAMLWPYQRIIGMGLPAVPLILRELQREPDHWFWALRAITGADPVDAEDKGNLDKMTQAWLKWGQDNGFLS